MESEVPTPTAAAGGAPTARQPANNVPNGEEEDVSMNLGLTASVASASASVVASPAVLSATVASASPVPSTPCATDAAPPAPTQTQMEEDSNEEDEEDIDGESDGVSENNENGSNNSDEEDGDDDSEDDDGDAAKTTLGGTVSTPSYALLTGILDDPKKSEDDPTKRSVVAVPITRLPATLGRQHKTQDANFFSLGDARLLSRNHVRIHYLDAMGGSLRSASTADAGDGLVYHARSSDDDAPDVGQIARPASMPHLPPSGCFVLECLGKNKITVGAGRRIGQGEAALLQNGTTVRFAGFSLYFLLPTNSSTSEGGDGTATKKNNVMRVPNPRYAAFQKKRAREEAKAAAAAVEAEAEAASSGAAAAAAAPSASKKKAKTEPSAATPTTSGAATGGGGKVGQAKVLADLEALPTATLLQRCREAVASDDAWGRPHQLLNSAVAVHAVLAAGRSAELRTIVAQHGGVARGEVLNWIRNSSVFTGWVDLMLGKLETKSYEKNISTAIARAGYSKNGHQRWAPPADIGNGEVEKEEEEEDEGEGEDGSGGGVDDDDDDGNGSDGGGGENDDDNENSGSDDDEGDEDESGEGAGEESGGDVDTPQEDQGKSEDMHVDHTMNPASLGPPPSAIASADSPSTTKSENPDGALV